VNETQVEAAVMAQTAARFERVNTSLTAMLRQLMAELSVLQTAWMGRGGRAFEAVKIQYETDLVHLTQALGGTAEAIRTSGASYASTDEASASRVARAGGGGISLPLEN
jgi:ESAT-6 family protein